MATLIGQAGQVRSRRTMAEMEELRAALVDIVRAGQPMTVRQVFYQMVVRNLIEKTEGSYNDVVVRLLVEHRRAGRIPWEWITGPRFPRYSRMYRDPAEILRGLGPRYRRYRWDTQPHYVSIWVEKEALAETLLAVTDPLLVKLWPGEGAPDWTFKYDFAQDLLDAGADRPCYVYYLGDHDPAGQNIPQVLERDVRELAPDVDLRFQRLALNPDQIRAWNLPSRPTKRNPRDFLARDFAGDSTELDAVPPDRLRSLVEEAIRRHIDETAWAKDERREQRERALLRQLAATWPPKRTSR